MKKFNLILAFTVLIGLLVSCKKEDCKGTPKAECICPENFDPVCGCDNVTYSNTCFAECAGIKDFTKGKCK